MVKIRHGVTRRALLKSLGVTTLAGVGGRCGSPAGAGQPAAIDAERRREPASSPDVEIELVARPDTAQIRPGSATNVWRYEARLMKGPAGTLEVVPDSYLGPTIRARTGQRLRVVFRNELPESSIVHFHGLHVPESMDGHPRYVVEPGGDYVYEFDLVNRAGTYWYHPHHHNRTGPQVYRGLAGLFIVSDEEEAELGLPAGSEEIFCVLQDRTFDGDNQLVYLSTHMEQMSGFLGQTVLVNGRLASGLSLETSAYRLRLLNGSNSRIYKIAVSDGTPLVVIGTDGGLLEHAVRRSSVTIAPGQRVDAILDLSSHPIGARLSLESLSFDAVGQGMGMGMGMGMGRGRGGGRGMMSGGGLAPANGEALSIMPLVVERRGSAQFELPGALSRFDSSWDVPDGLLTRRFTAGMRMMRWRLNGRTFDMETAAADETVALGAKEIWEFDNSASGMMAMAHPIHMHGRQFRVLSREVVPSMRAGWQSLESGLVDEGWRDTVLVMPGERVRVLVEFQRYRGLFLYHCHNLEHEDLGMMRNYRVI